MARRLALLAAALLIAGFGLVAWKGERIADRVLEMRFGARVPPPAFPAPRDTAQANLQDLDYLARLPEVERSFTPETRAEFMRRIARLRERAKDLDRGELLMGVAQAVAAADNPHTNVERAYWRAYLNSLPVRFEWFAEGLFVVRARSGHADLLRARVTAIDGVAVDELARDASRYFGGPPEHSRVSSLLVLESPQALHVMRPQAPRDRATLSVVDGEGRTRDEELPAVAPLDAPPVLRPGRLLSPQSDFSEKRGEWLGVLDIAGRTPRSLRDPAHSLYSVKVDEGVLYLHLWSIHSDARGKLGDQVIAALRDGAPWKRIVLDLRFDTGGDYPDVYDAMKHLPRFLAEDGRLVIIEDNTTFSAAIITAALAKHFADGRATIVGQRPRDRLVFWAEGNSLQLPNSKLEIPTPTALHDWEHGCRDFERCYWPNIWYSVAAGSVEPEIVIAWRFDDYRRGIDTVLERALGAR